MSALHIEESNITANIGNLDRALCIGAGVVLIRLAIAGSIGPWGHPYIWRLRYFS